ARTRDEWMRSRKGFAKPRQDSQELARRIGEGAPPVQRAVVVVDVNVSCLRAELERPRRVYPLAEGTAHVVVRANCPMKADEVVPPVRDRRTEYVVSREREATWRLEEVPEEGGILRLELGQKTPYVEDEALSTLGGLTSANHDLNVRR